MGCCCSSEEDEERQSLVISDPRSVTSSNPLATAPLPIESPIKTSTGGTPPPGPRLPPRRIRSTGPAPHTGSINEEEQPVTIISSSPPPIPPDAPSRIMSPVTSAHYPNTANPLSHQPPTAAAVTAAINADASLKGSASMSADKDTKIASKDGKKEKKQKKSTEKKEKKEKEKKGLFSRIFASSNKEAMPDEVVIGGPTGFRRDQHISWDPEHGFDWQTLFSKAGVTESELKNKDTALFIINVVAASLGSNSGWRTGQPNLAGSQQLSASQQQSIVLAPLPVSPESPPDVAPAASQSSYTSFSQLPAPDASFPLAAADSSQAAPLQPPLPPPRTDLEPRVPPAVPPRSDVINSTAQSADAPSAASLSPIAPPPPPAKIFAPSPSVASSAKPKPPAPARNETDDLLAAIRSKGAAGLKKVEAAPDLKKLSSKEADSLANVLSRAMEARRAFMRQDKKDGETEGNDDWDK